MRIALYIIGLALVLLLGFNVQAKGLQTKISNLDELLMISQDLEETAKVYISVNKKKDEKSCYCVCRYPSWVCTNSDDCSKHNNSCKNNDS